jgi:colanic acid/amylovoran biosynthesis glycosyltransferase
MKLAYITRGFPFAYIGEAFFAPEVRLLASLCEELHVIAARPEQSASVFGDLGATDVLIQPADPRTLASAFFEALRSPRRAAVALWRIVAPRYAIRAKIKNLVLFPKALAVARYVRKKQIEHIHAHWLTTPGTVAYVASTITGIPWSCTGHAHDIFSDNLLEQKVRSAAFVRVIAERNGRHLAEFTGFDPGAMHLIHLGVDVPQLPCHDRPTQRPLQIVCAARLDPIKGHEYLLQALATLRDRGGPFHCDIVGNGPLQKRISSVIASLSLERLVTLRGLVEHDVLLEELRSGRYDVVVLTSLEHEGVGQHEGIPVALIEAMAAAIPCIATDTGCIPELIKGGSGILVDQRDSAGLADALERIAEQPGLRRELGRKARELVLAQFDSVNTTRDLYDLICGDTMRATAGGQSRPRPVSRLASIPPANANCSAGKNTSVASVTSSGSSLARPRKTKNV